MKTYSALALLFGFLMASAAIAAESVLIDADSMEINDAEHRTIFRGNVVATRPTDKIVANEMVVSTAEVKQPDGTIKTVTNLIVAKGNVTISTANQTITGDSAKFYIQEDRLEVTGDVRVTQGKTTVKSKKLVINLKTKNMQASGGRVRVGFVPQ